MLNSTACRMSHEPSGEYEEAKSNLKSLQGRTKAESFLSSGCEGCPLIYISLISLQPSDL